MPFHFKAQPTTTRWTGLTLIVMISVAAVSAGLLIKATPWSNHPASPAIGKPAPRIDLVRLSDEGTYEEIDSRGEGKVVLLHCFGTWCGPCRAEFPHLSKLIATVAKQEQVEFLPISSERMGTETFESLWAETKKFFDEHQIRGIAYADPRGITRRSMAERLQRKSLYFPTSILIDRDGKIAGVWEGYNDDTLEQIRSAIRDVVSRSS
tara:strand:- start:71594 stop:72217 length:624 start_codon:yes stop_codon:yes gene_type:complete